MIERPFYGLPELAARWRCTIVDLIDMGLACHARICVRFYGPPDGCRVEHSTVTRSRDVSLPNEPPTFIRLAVLPWMPPGTFELETGQLAAIRENGLPHRLGFAYRCDGHEWEACRYSGEMPIVTEQNIGMLPDEVKRLERELFDLAAMTDPPAPASAEAARVPPVASATPPQGPWPWGDHETTLLRHLAAAAERFWKLYDPSDPGTAPTNEQLSAWLQSPERGVSKRNAEVIATILRADGLATGRRSD